MPPSHDFSKGVHLTWEAAKDQGLIPLAWQIDRVKEGLKHMGNPTKNSEFTYANLLAFLQTLTPEQLAQPVQIIPPGPEQDEEACPLALIIGAGTVEHYFHVEGEMAQATRNALDNTHTPEAIVLHAFANPFSKDGDTSYTLLADGRLQGDKTGKIIDFLNTDDE